MVGYPAVVSMMGATALVGIVLQLVMVEKSVAEQHMEALGGGDVEHAKLLEQPVSTQIATITLLLNPRGFGYNLWGVWPHWDLGQL
jgi:hypothetical protein